MVRHKDMIEVAFIQVKKMLIHAGVTGDFELSVPPKPEMGDVAFPCFDTAKAQKKSPAEVAEILKSKIQNQKSKMIERIEAFGPYVNFFLNANELTKLFFEQFETQGAAYGSHADGKGKKVLVEFGCPNPLKVFHLGHLKNLITGESVARIFENAGYDVVRVNYQGDVGMHVAKSLWGMYQTQNEFDAVKEKPLVERIAFLGRAYAHGATQYEKDETAKQEIEEYNEKVYEKDPAIQEVYQITRQWSLDYFETIYKKLDTRFDKLYFESDIFKRGKEIVLSFTKKRLFKKPVFKKSEGAIIFPGSEYGLHDRVFINSKGYPTYEAKDLALAERHFRDYQPNLVVHVVGKEQTEYFQVVFRALEQMMPKTKDKEYHLIGGYLQLKGQKKMSSRTGNVIAGDELLAEVEKRIREIMGERAGEESDDVIRKVTGAALKYAMLKADVSQDAAFDMESSVATVGDSGPYLQYIVARIKSILRKIHEIKDTSDPQISIPPSSGQISNHEKQLIMALLQFPDAAKRAADQYNPSHIAQYLFSLAQTFNQFYEHCPVLDAEKETRKFRFGLLHGVEQVMTRGLWLLGIEVVDRM